MMHGQQNVVSYYLVALVQWCGPFNEDGISFTLGCDQDTEMVFALILCGAQFLLSLL
jgi:hypothetical protein